MEKIPSLAGQPAFFILNQLFLMREAVRKVEAMAPFVKELKDEDLQALSEHFSKRPAKTSGEPIDPALARRGAEIAAQRRCGSCHLPTLAGQEQMPRLARQRIDYLIPTLKSYRDGPRPGADTAMSAAIVGATDDDIKALAHYAASL
jgi:cytochrome c553